MTRAYRWTPEGLQARRRVMADPEVRARHRAAMADPEVRARQEKNAGWLSAEERDLVVAALRANQSYDAVAADWLISYGRVAQIAKEEGLQRRKRAKVALERARP